jgi:hypothetical protein
MGALRRDGVEAAIAGILSLNVLRLGTYEILPGLSSTGPIIGANLLRQSLLGSQMRWKQARQPVPCRSASLLVRPRRRLAAQNQSR